MPGIVGIIAKKQGDEAETKLRRMINCMAYEPFYSKGAYVNRRFGFYLGWVCHEGAFSDCLPVFNENKELVLLFAGENFVDEQVLEELKRRGHEFNASDASYLVHLYEEDPKGFLPRLNGWFSGVLIDLRQGRLLLFNDRYGMQRVYYHESKDGFYFASEAKSLLKVCPQLREIDERGVGEFFVCGCVLENRTLFPNIFLLPGAAAWRFANGCQVQKGCYFRRESWEKQPMLQEESFYERLKETLVSILPSYFRSRQRVGMSLTGGLDSRLILSYVDIPPGKVPFYTFGGMYRDCFDVRVAREVARACRQSHEVLLLDKRFLADFAAMAEKTVYATDGCLDVCGAHNIYLNRLAREIAPIRLTGLFGSEVLRSVSGFKAAFLRQELFHPDFKRHILAAESTCKQLRQEGHPLSFLLFREAPWLKSAVVSAEQSQLTYRTPFMDNAFVSLIYQAPPNARAGKEISLRLLKDGSPLLFDIRTDRGFAGKEIFLFSKAVQLAYLFMFKAEWYYNTGAPHWLVRVEHALPLDRLILGRNKIEHYRLWFHGELSGYVQDVLLERRTLERPFWEGKRLRKMVEQHVKGVGNYLAEINKVLTIELVWRLLVENI